MESSLRSANWVVIEATVSSVRATARSSRDLASVAKGDDKHQEFALGYVSDDAVFAHPVPPKTALTDLRNAL